MTARQQKYFLVGSAIVIALTCILMGMASHYTTPRGRVVGTIDLLGDRVPVLDIDVAGKPVRFSIDIVADTTTGEIRRIADGGRLEITGEGTGAPLHANCATFAGNAHDTAGKRVRPQYVRGAELDCVLDGKGATRLKVRATATWPAGRPTGATLSVRVGDER